MIKKIETLSIGELDGSVVDLMVKLAGYIKQHPEAYIDTESRKESFLDGSTHMNHYIHIKYNDSPKTKSTKPDSRIEAIAKKFASKLVISKCPVK